LIFLNVETYFSFLLVLRSTSFFSHKSLFVRVS